VSGTATLAVAEPGLLARMARDRAMRPWWTILLALAALCWLAPPLLPFAPEHTDWAHLDVGPGFGHGHALGTDAVGRDVLARVLHGGRLSLTIGLVAALAAMALGLAYGTVAGYVGGALERVMLRALDVLSAVPFLLIVVLLMSLFERSLMLLLTAIAGYVWLDLARVARAEAARLRTQPYIVAARAMGASSWWILTRHVLPQLTPLALAYLGVLVPQAILVESFLGFLGLSIDEPAVSWGGLLHEGVQEMLDAPWVLLAPAAALVLTLLALTRISERVRELADPRGVGA
jgi:oligopeptide transport system permease protein